MNFIPQGAPLAEPVAFKDIAEYHYEAGVLNNPYHFTGLIIGIVVLVVGAFLFLHYYRKKKLVTPWDWARSELNKLDPSSYERPEEFVGFYVGLTRVLKWYVERRFELSVNHKTDDEVVVFLKQQATSRRGFAELYKAVDALYADLEKLFEGAKYVKFAQVAALKERALADRETVREFINRTIPEKK